MSFLWVQALEKYKAAEREKQKKKAAERKAELLRRRQVALRVPSKNGKPARPMTKEDRERIEARRDAEEAVRKKEEKSGKERKKKGEKEPSKVVGPSSTFLSKWEKIQRAAGGSSKPSSKSLGKKKVRSAPLPLWTWNGTCLNVSVSVCLIWFC